MNEYEINEYTLGILPISDNKSIVYEGDDIYYVEKSSNKIMEDSCLYYGSSLDGRVKGTEKMIGISYKSPIIVDENKEIIFFPTCSSRYHNPAWIGIKNLKLYYRMNQKVILEFQNGVKIDLNLSYGVVDNQVLRATRLESALRGRKTF